MFIFKQNKVNIDAVQHGYVVFEYDHEKISKTLTDNDLTTIKEIFNHKKLYNDHPSCGFSEKIAIYLDETQVFCIACDDCPIIYLKNKNLFFKISDQENKLLRNILIQYGFHFPCI